MIDASLEMEIRRLFFAEHWKRGTIAQQLGVHPDVVARVIGPLGPDKEGHTRASCLDPYRPVVDEILAKYPRLRATRIYDMLKGRGYPGSLRTLRRYVKDARPTPKAEVFLRTQRLPGEQAQVDWGHVGNLNVQGGTRALWVFVLVLAYSRAMWAELVLDLSVHALRRSLLRASMYFEGVPRQWLFDNPKTVVLARNGDAVRYHPQLLSLCAALHVEPRLCGVRKPQEKGHVERTIRYLKDRFFAARTIQTIESGNRQLLDFIERIAAQRPHPTMPDKTVCEVFEEEKPRLLALPPSLPSVDTILPVSVDKTAFAQFDTNRYSVPSEYGHMTLTLVASDTSVRLLDQDQIVAEHVRCFD